MENVLVVRADANSKMGTGHLMRCLALGQAWQDAGCKVVFITACRNEALLQRLRQEKFEVHLLTQSYPDPADWDSTKNILAKYPEAWVVLDGYHFDETYQKLVKGAGHRLLVVDDMAHLKHYYADILLNQNLHAEQLQYSCEPYTRLLLGTKYALLRREFLGWKDWQREIPEVGKRVLVTLGGSDPDNHTLKVIEVLQEVKIPGLEATVVAGASNTHIETLEAAVRQSGIPIRIIQDAQNMPELMAWADVAIATAGSSSWELLFLGTPALFMVSAENQRYIAEQIGKEEVGKNLGWAQELAIGTLRKELTNILKDPALRTKMSQKARQIVDGRGTERLLNILKAKTTSAMPNTTSDFPCTNGLKVFFLGGRQAGCIGLLTLAAAGCEIQGAVAYDEIVGGLTKTLNIPTFPSIDHPRVQNLISQSDLLVSAHGREIVPEKLLKLPRLGAINVHPCLYRYKGADPVARLLKDGCPRASVGVHRMTAEVDAGEVLVEDFVDVTDKQTVEEVYNALYPLYSLTLLKALRKLCPIEAESAKL